MYGKRKAKLMVAASLGAVILTFALLVLVLPATNLGGVATEAQPQTPGPPGMGPPGMGPPGMGMPGQMGMMGMGMEAAPAPAVNVFEGDPLESSRPNPFLSGTGRGFLGAVGTTYGPNWQQMPLASRMNIGPAERAPEPEPVAGPEVAEQKFMRISGIMWTGNRPLAIYEMRSGDTGSVQPGDIVDDWLDEQIGQDYVMVRNIVSAERRRVPLKTK